MIRNILVSDDIPSISDIMLPLLETVNTKKDYTPQQVVTLLWARMKLSPNQRRKVLPSGNSTVFGTRVGWAISYLRKAELLTTPQKGSLRISEKGKKVLENPPARITVGFLQKITRTVKSASPIKSPKKPEKLGATNKRTKSGNKIPQSGRPALFHQILTEAGEPLHYATIYERALELLPKDKHFAKNLAYITLYSTPAFKLISPGVFGLITWTDNLKDANGNVVFTHCPQPLLPDHGDTKAFFESVMVGVELLNQKPFISAKQFYAAMLDWAKKKTSAFDAQSAFNAWYAAGLLAYVDYAQSAESFVELTIDSNASLSDVRTHCLEALYDRIKMMPELLFTLTRLPRPTVDNIQTAMFGQGQNGHDILLRLSILAAFEAVRREDDEWRVTAVGQRLIEANPAVDFKFHEQPVEVEIPTVPSSYFNDVYEDALYDIEVVSAPRLKPVQPQLLEIQATPDKSTVHEYMRTCLYEAIHVVFPLFDPDKYIKIHAWGNKEYVGEYQDRSVLWRGWSANLWYADEDYHTVYIDRVDNVLPLEQRRELFGPAFASAICPSSALVGPCEVLN